MSNYKIFSNVEIEENVYIEDYVIIGVPPKGKKDGELETIIGDNAIIRSHTVIYAGNKIGDDFQTGHHVTIREENYIGNNVSIGTSSCIEHHITIEDDVRLHSQTFIPEYSRLEKGCWIGPNVVLTNAKYPKSKNVMNNLKGSIIKEKAKIGANTTILPGKTIGKNALIGAGTVVTKDVPNRKIVAGNPGKIIGSIDDISEY
ncbi:MAG: transferase [Firmicutes bacterium]|nr:transferase [Bacillota bacterium]